jgi:hypothetical protein
MNLAQEAQDFINAEKGNNQEARAMVRTGVEPMSISAGEISWKRRLDLSANPK